MNGTLSMPCSSDQRLPTLATRFAKHLSQQCGKLHPTKITSHRTYWRLRLASNSPSEVTLAFTGSAPPRLTLYQRQGTTIDWSTTPCTQNNTKSHGSYSPSFARILLRV